MLLPVVAKQTKQGLCKGKLPQPIYLSSSINHNCPPPSPPPQARTPRPPLPPCTPPPPGRPSLTPAPLAAHTGTRGFPPPHPSCGIIQTLYYRAHITECTPIIWPCPHWLCSIVALFISIIFNPPQQYSHLVLKSSILYNLDLSLYYSFVGTSSEKVCRADEVQRWI